jgi:uncharacterized protein
MEDPAVAERPRGNTGIVDTSRSPARQLQSLPFDAVRFGAGFWSVWRATNRREALPYGYDKLVSSGVISNFEVAAGRKQGSFQNMRFADSDLYKWLEAAAYELANQYDGALDRKVDDAVALMAAAQRQDGYLDTYYQLGDYTKRWTNLTQDHEMYCAGHMFQAAVAHFRATGKRSFLDVARKLADHIDSVFGPNRKQSVDGHPEVEMGLVELYRVTGEKRYLELARFFVDIRGRGTIGGSAYYQDHMPVREAPEMIGHAVRQVYLLAGVADLYLETSDKTLLSACERLWDDMTTRKMSLTGGIGARHEKESFGESFELPSDRAYNETCAQIGSVMWNWRMLLATANPRYADLIEWTLYNGVLSGVSLDGKRYFYPNPLLSRGSVERSEWFACACCPPNVMRTVSSVQNYAATTTDGGLQVHLYDRCAARATLAAAGDVSVSFDTDYPWEPVIKVTVDKPGTEEWTLSLRIPGWCAGGTARINGGKSLSGRPGSYVDIRRRWQPGDTVVLDLPMPVKVHEPHPWIEPARGCLALTRGPLVYCFEENDQQAGVRLLDTTLDPAAPAKIEHQPSLLGGVTTLKTQGRLVDHPGWEGRLYRTYGTGGRPRSRKVGLTAIPYFAWANRKKAPMRVWMQAADATAPAPAAKVRPPAPKATARAAVASSKNVRKTGSKRPVKKIARNTARRKG